MAKRFTPPGLDADRVIDRILVLASDRKALEQEQIPEFFTPVTGEWKIKSECLTYLLITSISQLAVFRVLM